MSFLDKVKDLFSDEEEIIETKEIEVEEEPKKKEEERKLPTFMRNKIEEEQKREEAKKKEEEPEIFFENKEIVKTRSNNFTFPIEMDDFEEQTRYSNQNVLKNEKPKYSSQASIQKEKEKEKLTAVSELYSKKEEPKPKRFRPTPVISPVYGVLDKNYTKDEVKVQDESSYEIQRPSRKVDFETVHNKAYGSLTDDIRNNLCENCDLYQEVKITKNADKKLSDLEVNILEEMVEEKPKEDISLGDAEDNYFDFGVDYEIPKREKVSVINADKVEINNDIKIVNHNDEESEAEKIEIKEEIVSEEKTKRTKKEPVKKETDLLEDTKEFENLTHDEEDILTILGSDDDIPIDSEANDIFNLIDSMYDEEDK